MTPRMIFSRALQILIVAGVIAAIGYLSAADRQVEQAAMKQYCQAVATWNAEARRGVSPYQRTGHPDYDDIADEQCVGAGLRPTAPALDNQSQRQLVQN